MTDHPDTAAPLADSPTPSHQPSPGAGPGLRPRLFDDVAGMAGGAVSALLGLKQEAGAMGRARVDEAIRRLDLVRREEMDAAMQMAATARAGQEAAETLIGALQARLAVLEARIDALEAQTPAASGGAPGMIT